MSRSKLNDKQKARVIELVESGKATQQQIANYFNVSQRTIHRVLVEAGMVHTGNHLSDRDKDCLKIIREYGLSATQLKEILERPALTADNMVRVVSDMNDESLGRFIFNVTKARVIREYQQQEAQAARARASNGEMAQEALYA